MSVSGTYAGSVPAAPPRRARGRARAEPPVPEPGSVTGSSPGRPRPLPGGRRRCGRSAARPRPPPTPIRYAGEGAGAALPPLLPPRPSSTGARVGDGGARRDGGGGAALAALRIFLSAFPFRRSRVKGLSCGGGFAWGFFGVFPPHTLPSPPLAVCPLHSPFAVRPLEEPSRPPRR